MIITITIIFGGTGFCSGERRLVPPGGHLEIDDRRSDRPVSHRSPPPIECRAWKARKMFTPTILCSGCSRVGENNSDPRTKRRVVTIHIIMLGKLKPSDGKNGNVTKKRNINYWIVYNVYRLSFYPSCVCEYWSYNIKTTEYQKIIFILTLSSIHLLNIQIYKQISYDLQGKNTLKRFLYFL